MWRTVAAPGGFRWLLASRAASGLGDWFTYMLMIVVIYQRSGNPLDSMAIVATQAVATLAISSWAGPLVDTVPLIRIMLAGDLVRMVLVAALFWAPPSPGAYAADAFLIAGCAALFGPAAGRWARIVLPQGEYGSGIAAMNVTTQIMQVVGPGFALWVLSSFGRSASAGFFIDALSFAVSAGLLLLSWRDGGSIPYVADVLRGRSQPSENICSKWKHVAPSLMTEPLLTGIVVLLAIVVCTGGTNVVLLVFAHRSLALGAYGVGYLVSAISVGVVIGSLLSEPATRRLSTTGWMGMGVLGSGVFTVIMGLCSETVVSLAALVIIGGFNGILNVKLPTFMQSEVPLEHSGRVFSAIQSAMGICRLLGIVLEGICLSSFGPDASLIGIGGGLIVTAMYGVLSLSGHEGPEGRDHDGTRLGLLGQRRSVTGSG